MKKILLITDVTSLGGVGTYIHEVAKLAVRAGYNVRILMDKQKESDLLHKSLINAGFCVYRVGLHRRSFSDEEISKNTEEVLYAYKPDLIHVFLGSIRSAVIPRQIAISTNIPLVFTEGLVSTFFSYDAHTLNEIKDIYNKTFRIITLCKENYEILRLHYKLPMENVSIIPNFVEVDQTKIIKRNVKRKYAAVTVARITHQKGIDVLLRAISLLPKTYQRKINFTIVGDGDQYNTCIELCRQLEIDEFVFFAGWKEDIREQLHEYDLFILPSRFEGQPHALLEALSIQIPCIATNVSGTPEILDGGRYGYIVNPEDSCDLMNSIKMFIDNPFDLISRATLSKEHLIEHHSIKTNISKIFEIWEQGILL